MLHLTKLCYKNVKFFVYLINEIDFGNIDVNLYILDTFYKLLKFFDVLKILDNLKNGETIEKRGYLIRFNSCVSNNSFIEFPKGMKKYENQFKELEYKTRHEISVYEHRKIKHLFELTIFDKLTGREEDTEEFMIKEKECEIFLFDILNSETCELCNCQGNFWNEECDYCDSYEQDYDSSDREGWL